MTADKFTVAVFDSGVGGLTIVSAIKNTYPTLKVVFMSDDLNFPYGNKTESQVSTFAQKGCALLVKQHNPDLLVIACNTASTIALEAVRQQCKLPVVGVVPAIKPAAQRSQTKAIGLLATPGTISRSYTDELIKNFAEAIGVKVVRVGSTRLVEIAEDKIKGHPIDSEEIRSIIAPFFQTGLDIDHIVLGCTHFPHLIEELTAASPKKLTWIDSGTAIAVRVGELLGIPAEN